VWIGGPVASAPKVWCSWHGSICCGGGASIRCECASLWSVQVERSMGRPHGSIHSYAAAACLRAQQLAEGAAVARVAAVVGHVLWLLPQQVKEGVSGCCSAMCETGGETSIKHASRCTVRWVCMVMATCAVECVLTSAGGHVARIQVLAYLGLQRC
jgi:hypothetical protein